MTTVHVVGAFVTPFGPRPDVLLRQIATDAVTGVLADAGATPEDVDAVYFSNSTEGALHDQHTIRGEVCLQGSGLLGRPIVNVENACASGATAFHLACGAIRGGQADVALVVGAERLSHPDKGRTFAVFSSGWDVERFGRPDPTSRQSGFMDVYAQMAQEYMDRSGATVEDFARVSVKSHANGALNPKAQFRRPVTVEEVLGGRVIRDPLTLLMCSPVGDGGAALLLASDDGLARLRAQPGVRVLASVLRSGTKTTFDGPGDAVQLAAARAYETAAVGPDDVDVVELHDAAAPGELIVCEDLGLGAGPELIRSGATELGGRVPVNPSGGLLSRGHPVGATGCAQLVELTDQLRGRCGPRQVPAARVALAENGGGWIGGDVAAVGVTILGR